MIPFWWACCTAWQTGEEQLQPLAEGQAVRRRSTSVIGTPLTSSMTK